MALSAISQVDITPNDTLMVLDEIQDCPKALETLKFFCEDAPDIHIIGQDPCWEYHSIAGYHIQ